MGSPRWMATTPIAMTPSKTAAPQTRTDRVLFMVVEHCVESRAQAQSLRCLISASSALVLPYFFRTTATPSVLGRFVIAPAPGVHSEDFILNSYRSKQ